MRVWERARPGSDACGGCVTLIVHGEPVLVATMEGLKRRLLRCVACAKVPVDESQLSAFDEAQTEHQTVIRHARPRGFVPIQELSKGLRFDAKLAQSGERNE